MKLLILILAYLPAAITLVGFIMWIIPRKNTYLDSLNFRQIVGKVLFFIGAAFSLMHVGVTYQKSFFEPCGEDSVYCYKFLALPKDTVYTGTMELDSAKSDSLQLTDTMTICGNTNNANEMYIPFEEVNNVKYITVNVGTTTIKAVFDTGCSYAMMVSVNDYYKMVGAGVIKEKEFTDHNQAKTANGASVNVHMFNLPKCSMNNIVFTDMQCGVANDCTETLVGSSAFGDATVVIDNCNKRIIVKK